jgi:adenylate cyclase
MEKADHIERRLAAILSADVHGYSRMMADDEVATVREVKRCRGIIDAHVREHRGRIVDAPGDNVLAEFPSAVEAVQCAVEVQRELADRSSALEAARRMEFRIGIHVGDVILEDGKIYGDGVNIAARLEALATPGGICISSAVHEQIRGKLDVDCDDIGEQRVKNIARPVRVLRVRMGATPLARTANSSLLRQLTLTAGAVVTAVLMAVAGWKYFASERAARRPIVANRLIHSIAVLPLDNLSGDPAQEYFADGMTEELITDLAKISALRVISRTSVMKFKGEHREQLPEIAKMLDVDAVVEGSVLRVGEKVRITAQLIDAPADKHLWANSYERDARDVLAVQDEIASAIAREVDVQLTPDERVRLTQARPVNPEAHEAYLKGRYFYSEPSEERVNKAIAQYEQAIKLDPNFAPAYTGLADAYNFGVGFYFPPSVIPKAKAAVEKALQLDDSSAEAHTSMGMFKYCFAYDWTGAESELRRAIALNPSYPEAHHQYGYVLLNLGRGDDALVEFKRASELDPLSPWLASDVSWPLIYQGKYEAAKHQCRKALDLDPNFSTACIWLADLQAGKFREAILEMEKARLQESSAPFDVASLGYCYGASGDRTRAKAMLEKLNQMAARQYVSPVAEAQIYIGLGDRQRALDRLEQDYQTRGSMLYFLKLSHVYDPLRSEPRFIALLKKVHLDK